MTGSWKVKPLTVDHLPQVVAAHLRSFPNFFLTFLGPAFLREFYRGVPHDPEGIGYVAQDEDGAVLGVIVGAVDPPRYFQRLFRRRWWAFGLASIRALAKKPTILPRLLRAIFYRGEPLAGPSRSLLSSVAVVPEAQGRGVGAALVQAWIHEVRARGSQGCYLTTDAEHNDSVNRFYRHLGWTFHSSHRTPEGRRINCFVLDFAVADVATPPKRRAA